MSTSAPARSTTGRERAHHGFAERGKIIGLAAGHQGVRPTRAHHHLFVDRDAPVVTGGAYADGFLITMRAAVEAAPNQVSLVYADRDQLEIQTRGTWDPLGMRATTYDPVEPFARGYVVHPWSGTLREESRTDTGAMAPAGQLWSTVADLARWAAFLERPVARVLAPDTVTEMSRPVSSRSAASV